MQVSMRWPTAIALWFRAKTTWLSIAFYGVGILLALWMRGSVKGSDLVSFAGALVGAGASVTGALLVVDYQRRAARQQSIDSIRDDLEVLHSALEPFAAERPINSALASDLTLRVERDEAIRRIEIVLRLNERIIDRGLDVGARFLLRLLEISATLAQADWSKPDALTRQTTSTGTTYRIASISKLNYAQQIRGYIEDALTEIGSPAPRQARASLVDQDDVSSGA